MPDGGRLAIAAANAEFVPGNSEDLPPGRYVVLSVRDSGHGIAPDLLARVFEPFFTTKDTGRGSGLGLSMVYGFVTQSGGHIRIGSEPDAGTEVRIYLPRSLEGAPADDAAPGVAGASAARERHEEAMARARPGETVLLVEDNDDVRRFGLMALAQLGYRVVPAADGRAAPRCACSTTERLRAWTRCSPTSFFPEE